MTSPSIRGLFSYSVPGALAGGLVTILYSYLVDTTVDWQSGLLFALSFGVCSALLYTLDESRH